MRGCPAVDDQGRIFACLQNRLLAFPPGDPRPSWEYVTTGPIPRSPAVGSDGNVRVHAGDGYLHVVTPSGQRLFDPVAAGEPLGWAMPLVDAANNTWICPHTGGLMKIDSTGLTSQKPFLRTRLRFDATGLIFGDAIFLGGEDHFLHAIRTSGERGEDLWASSPGHHVLMVGGRTGCAIHAAIALAAGPQFLVASQDNYLHAFGLDGKELWLTSLPGQPIGSPIVNADGTIYLGVSQNPRNQQLRGMLLALDPVSHQVRWSYPAGPIEFDPGPRRRRYHLLRRQRRRRVRRGPQGQAGMEDRVRGRGALGGDHYRQGAGGFRNGRRLAHGVALLVAGALTRRVAQAGRHAAAERQLVAGRNKLRSWQNAANAPAESRQR